MITILAHFLKFVWTCFHLRIYNNFETIFRNTIVLSPNITWQLVLKQMKMVHLDILQLKKKKALKFIRLHQLAENNNSFMRVNHSLVFPFNKKQQSTGCSQPKLLHNFSTHPHSNHTKSLFKSNHPFWSSVSYPSQTLVEWRALKVSKQPINVTMLLSHVGRGQPAEKIAKLFTLVKPTLFHKLSKNTGRRLHF